MMTKGKMICKKICKKHGYGFDGFGMGSMSFADRLVKPSKEIEERTKMMCKKIHKKNGYGFDGFGVGSMSFSDRNMSKPDQKKAVYLSLCVNNVCGLGCEHCIAKINRESDDNFEVIAAELKGLGPAELNKITMASISGLEPTETPDRICYMADFFHQKNIQTILMTNGIKLDSRMQNDLAGLIDYFDPSIDGLRSTCKPALKNGGYSKAWANIKSAIDSGFAKKTGIIVTAREENINELPELFHFFEEELGGNEEVCSTLWFYLGADLLPKNLLMAAIKAAVQSPYRQLQIAVPEHHHAYLRDVFAEFGPSDLKYCSQTGVPSVMIEGIKMLLPSLAGGFKAVLRIESDGDIYRGCEHFLGSEENFLGPYHCLKQIISSF
jgi:hypothetical protein